MSSFFVSTPSVFDLDVCKRDLESSNVKSKITALQSAIVALGSSGDDATAAESLLIPVIRYAMPCKDKIVKKLALLFLENIKKYGSDGQLKSEMILVCNAIRNDLQHPNEYYRGFALRFLCRLSEPEILEPLLPSVKASLSAALAVLSIHKTVPFLWPDAFDTLQECLEKDTDSHCIRIILNCLCSIDCETTVQALFSEVGSSDEALLALITFAPPSVFQSIDRAQLLEALNRLPASGKIAILTAFYLKEKHGGDFESDSLDSIFQPLLAMTSEESSQPSKSLLVHFLHDFTLRFANSAPKSLIVDIISLLSSANIDLESRVYLLALCKSFVKDAVAPMVFVPIARLLKGVDRRLSSAKEVEYAESILSCLTSCLDYFLSAGTLLDGFGEVVHNLQGFGAFEKISSSLALFFQKAFLKFSDKELSSWLSSTLRTILSPHRFDANVLESLLTAASEHRASFPCVADLLVAEDTLSFAESASKSQKAASKTKILQDGTYGYDSDMVESAVEGGLSALQGLHACRSFVFFLSKADIQPSSRSNEQKARSIAKLVRTLKLVSPQLQKEELRLLQELLGLIKQLSCSPEPTKSVTAGTKVSKPAFDGPESLSCFCTSASLASILAENAQSVDFGENLNLSKRALMPKASAAGPQSSLQSLVQMTGFTDPIYAESFISLSGDMITIDFLIVNQTQDCTFTNIQVDFALPGKMKLVEQSKSLHLCPSQFSFMKYVIRSSSEDCAASIHSSVSFSTMSSAHSSSILLEEIMCLDPIVIPIVDFVSPASTIPFSEFSSTWLKLEWENKISIGPLSKFGSIQQLLSKLVCDTRLQLLSDALPGAELEFFSTNIYGKTIFGDDICANVSLEKTASNHIKGHMRLRSQSQSVALALGDFVHSIISE